VQLQPLGIINVGLIAKVTREGVVSVGPPTTDWEYPVGTENDNGTGSPDDFIPLLFTCHIRNFRYILYRTIF
jgi:hypothetical protein